TLPPLLMASVRFLLAGALLYAWARSRGAPRPTASQWRAATVVGGLLFVGGNGAVVVAEQWVPSGLVALLVAAVPLWLVILDWRVGSRERPTRRVVIGLVGGFLGVGILAGSPGVGAGGAHELFGAGLVILGSAAWAGGSMYARHADTPPRPRLWVAMQMLTGGAILLPLSLSLGEWGRFDVASVSLKSALALLYLVVFGALLAFSAYIWLLTVSTPARVGTYAYVNPVTALVLGWALAGEPLTFRSLVAATIIVGSVVIITGEGRARRRTLPTPTEDAAEARSSGRPRKNPANAD
ncbi:MAG TPA: EamA family transporter, partial [Longimicrobiales bacterium]|nr:EamA family transporter [Longimicrobiales bacterium]